MSKAYLKELIAMGNGQLNSALRNIDRTYFRGVLRLALREQDRDTRYACIEAILKCPEDVSGQCIWKDDAQRACMDARVL